jgi:hypothetical protein
MNWCERGKGLISKGVFGSKEMEGRGGEGRNFNEGEGRDGEGRRNF